jgi:hypothetical protein
LHSSRSRSTEACIVEMKCQRERETLRC